MSKRTVVHNGDPVKKYPRNKEGGRPQRLFHDRARHRLGREGRAVVFHRRGL